MITHAEIDHEDWSHSAERVATQSFRQFNEASLGDVTHSGGLPFSRKKMIEDFKPLDVGSSFSLPP